MKVSTSIDKKGFNPVSLTITFESQKELDDFGCLCNLTAITDTIKVPCYSFLETLGADVDSGADNLMKKIKNHPSMKNIK